MTLIKLLTAPIRRLVNFPPFQICIAFAIILILQVQDEKTVAGQALIGLQQLVEASLNLLSTVFSIKYFTRSWLISGLGIAYVYVVYVLALAITRRCVRKAVDVAGRYNFLGLRNAIARERGIQAYRAWEPLEKIRPDEVPQNAWEEQFAWPADNTPPYPSIWRRWLFEAASFVILALIVVILLQEFTFIPALSWLATVGKWVLGLLGWHWWPLGP